MSLIPKPEYNNDSSRIIPPSYVKQIDTINFSFKSLETNQYFNLDSTCQSWFKDLLKMLKEISQIKKEELLSGRYKTYRVHSHESASPPERLPNGIDLKSFYQMRISSSKVGIHGVFYENTFYVIWLDPLHNMYPDDRFGGLRIIRPPKNCCMDLEEKIIKLNEEKDNLQKDIDSLLKN